MEVLEEVQLQKKKLHYLKKELLHFEEARELLSLSKTELLELVYLKEIPFYGAEDELIYFRKSDLKYWMLFGKVSTTEDFQKIAANFIDSICRS